MKTCAEIEPLVTPYLDGEAPLHERAVVESHLTVCLPCRDRAEAERSAKGVVQDRRSFLGARAPESLRARCAATTRNADRAVPPTMVTLPAAAVPRAPRRTWIPFSMAASILLALGGVFIYGQNTRLVAALAAQLTLDHVKCFASAADAEPTRATPNMLETTFQTNYGWHVTIPASSDPEHLELLTARRCQYHQGQMAHVLYRKNGHPVSLFVLPNERQAQRVVEMMGHEAVIWSKDGRTYVLVGREPPEEMEHLAVYVRTKAQ